MRNALRGLLGLAICLCCNAAAAEPGRLDYGAKNKSLEAVQRLDSGDVEGAKQLLSGILQACQGECSERVLAGLHMYLGVVEGTGIKDLSAAEEQFGKGLSIDPSIPLDEGRSDAPTKEAYARAATSTAGYQASTGVLFDVWKDDVAAAKAQSAAPAATALEEQPESAQCYPACRQGYVCSAEGQCVSLCNPPCVEGQICSAEGTCEGTPTAVSAAGAPAAAGPADPGWATAAGVVGLVGGGIGLGFAVGSMASADEMEPAVSMGAVSLLTFAVTGPITAVGAASARNDPRVKGSVGSRIGGWIGYGATMLNGAVLIGLGVAEVDVDELAILSVGLLGLTSNILFSIDAFVSAGQARNLASLGGSRYALTDPTESLARRQPIRFQPMFGKTVSTDALPAANIFGLNGTF